MSLELKKTITNENDFVTKLADINALPQDVNFDLLNETTKTELDELEKSINDFLVSNTDFENYTEDQKNTLFDQVIDMWDKMGAKIKHAVCTIEATGIEINTINKKLHQNVEYTSETIFYGLHLKNFFLDKLPKTTGDFDKKDINITFSHAVALHHILSAVTVKGLNKDSYAYAHLLYTLQEVTKIYSHYDVISKRLNNAIGRWNLGLTNTEFAKLNEAITETIVSETTVDTATN